MLQLYGNSRSRAMRCLWMLEEVGEPYQLIEKSTRADDLQSAEYLGLNPNARIPTLVDGEVVLWESMAINLYLAQKYQGPMHCAGPEVLGLAAQWSFWAVLETEALPLDLLQHRACCRSMRGMPRTRNVTSCCLRKPLSRRDLPFADVGWRMWHDRLGSEPGLRGPHVRFRRVQPLVREGSPMVKRRNSA